jgi:hypothetical protein
MFCITVGLLPAFGPWNFNGPLYLGIPSENDINFRLEDSQLPSRPKPIE